MPKVLIIGNGIAGLSCARLLVNRGWELEIWGKRSLLSPTVIVNQVTCGLLSDIWQLEPSFWNSLHHLRQRRVCWGQDGRIIEMDEPSVAIASNLLSDRLRSRLLEEYKYQVRFEDSSLDLDKLDDLKSHFTWIIDAGGRQSPITQHLGAGHRYTFGDRSIISQEVALTDSSEQDIYWIETVTEGWLFLAPLGNKKAIIQAMLPVISQQTGEILPALLQRSRYIQSHIARLLGQAIVFPAYPQILQPLCSDRYLAVGDAAFSVDPISGDGTGYALRGAILATSIINGIASGSNSRDSLQHYTWRLEKAFATHLQHCLEYYLNGFSLKTDAWQAEIEKMHTKSNLWHPSTDGTFTHTLTGFQLIKI